MSRSVNFLLVEDNAGDAFLVKDALENGAIPSTVAVVHDGAAALTRLGDKAQASPDLIILDLNLPKLDGRQVLDALKAHPDWCHIPVVMFSSSDAHNDIVECYRRGASCYVPKPMGLDRFRAVIRSVERFWLEVARLP